MATRCLDCPAEIRGWGAGPRCRTCETIRQTKLDDERKIIQLCSNIDTKSFRPRHKGKR